MALRPLRAVKLAGLALLLAYWGWNFIAGQRELAQARREYAALVARRDTLRARAAQLRREVESLQRDAESRSRAARELLGVCGVDEKVVILPEP
ncbi:MAG: septum formation initiator family protein [Thermoanaerobaculum sp.]